MVICYAIVYPCSSNAVEDAIILDLGLQGGTLSVVYTSLIGYHFTSATSPFTAGTQYYVDSICCSSSCLLGFPPGPYPSAPSQSNLTVATGPCPPPACIVTLQPCPSGNPIYINVGTQGTVGAVIWAAFVNRVIQNPAPGFAGIDWYVESICCDVTTCPDYLTILSLAVPAPNYIQNVPQYNGPCIQTTYLTCCAVLTNCVTDETLHIAVGQFGSSEYTGWEALIDSVISDDTNTYTDTWYVEGMCCTENLEEPCSSNNACTLNSSELSYLDVTVQNEGPCLPVRYKLTNCKTNEIHYTNSLISEYVNSVINIEEYEGCWFVEDAGVGLGDTEATIIQGYDDCLCCTGPEPVKYVRTEPKPDRIFYQIAQSQCDINANIRFGNAYYALFKKLKHGMGNCCDNLDMDKTWIRKELSDYAVINDPTACTITTPVTPVICPEPEGNPYIPPDPPPGVYYFHVADDDGETNFNCTQCLDGSDPGSGGVCPPFNFTLDYNIYDGYNPFATFVFSLDGGGCVTVPGFFIASGTNESYDYTFDMTNGYITEVGVNPPDPCLSCYGG
jgi:hypothetical protein